VNTGQAAPRVIGNAGTPWQFRPRRILAIAVVLMLAVPALARSWHIADFHSTIDIDQRGYASISERIDLVFVGSYNGIWRSIPVEYPGPNGSNYSLFLRVDSVTDGEGQALKHEVSRDGDYKKIKIYIPGASDTTKTVVITYSVPNAIRWFDDHDEFYWNVTGNDWPVPIDHAAATVSFPANTAGSLRAQAFTGVYGSHDQEATAQVNGSRAEFESTNPLVMRGGLTVDVYIPKGPLSQPSWTTRAGWFLRSNIVVLVPLWTLLVMFTLWWYKGRDPDPGESVAPQYEPPAKLAPAEAGTLIDDSLDPRDITSTLVDLAVRGYLKIEQTDTPGIFTHHKDYNFHLLKGIKEWGEDLKPFERVVLENVFFGGTFAGGEITSLSSLKNRFYTAIPIIKDDIFASLRSQGMYFLDPQSAIGYSVLGAIIVAAPLVAFQVFGWINLVEAPAYAFGAFAVSAIIFFLFARVMSAKTVLGAKTKVHIAGFQEFMNRVDADRIKRLPPDTFEKYLPYAMALGVEQQWARAFAGIITQPPSWYAGTYTPGYWNPMLFTSNLNTMAATAHQAMVAAPRASSTGSGWSSGGGFGGGGFSGGGFGGGGGGAF
jgi:uncharacterized membrane protein YgcG